MSEQGLTREERRCLQLWFRQAIAEVEKNEVTAQMIRRHGLQPAEGHRPQVTRRHAPRSIQIAHRKELVAR